MRVVLIAALLLLYAAPASAQSQVEPGEIGVFWDPAGTQSRGEYAPVVPFEFYVVVGALDYGLQYFEFEILHPSANWFVLSYTIPFDYLNLSSPPGFVVGLGSCVMAVEPTVLVAVQALAFTESANELVCLTAATPSSFVPPTPGYATCLGWDDLRPFGVAQSGGGVYPDGCMVANPTDPEYPIETDTVSWGSIKARY